MLQISIVAYRLWSTIKLKPAAPDPDNGLQSDLSALSADTEARAAGSDV